MTLHITPDNQLHDDADGFALSLPSWPKDARIATEEEISTILNPPETPEKTKAKLLAEINTLEASQYMGRGEREAWLVLTLNTAAQQGYTEEQIYAVNPFYRKLKDQNEVIKALRAQL